LHLGGKTISDISKNVHMSFSAISKIIKTYEKKSYNKLKRRKKSIEATNKKTI
jgi:transposase